MGLRSHCSEEVKDWTTEQLGFESRYRQKAYLFSEAPRPAPMSTQFPLHCVLGTTPLGRNGQGVKLTNSPHLMPKLRGL